MNIKIEPLSIRDAGRAKEGARSTLSLLWSFQIRRTAFLNYIKFADLEALK